MLKYCIPKIYRKTFYKHDYDEMIFLCRRMKDFDRILKIQVISLELENRNTELTENIFNYQTSPMSDNSHSISFLHIPNEWHMAYFLTLRWLFFLWLEDFFLREDFFMAEDLVFAACLRGVCPLLVFFIEEVFLFLLLEWRLTVLLWPDFLWPFLFLLAIGPQEDLTNFWAFINLRPACSNL